jgi:hypothetical protein
MEVPVKHLTILACAASLFLAAPAAAQAPACELKSDSVVVTAGETVTTIAIGAQPWDCLVAGDLVHVALGTDGIGTWRLKEGGIAGLVGKTAVAKGDVVRLRQEGTRVFAVLAKFQVVPMVAAGDGTLVAETLSGMLAPATTGSIAGGPPALPTGTGGPIAAPLTFLAGKVLEVHSDNVVINLGKDKGVEKGMHFEVRSQKKVKKFNLETKTEDLLPSNEVTGILDVIQVSETQAMLLLGRGNTAEVGDLVYSTRAPLSETKWWPAYERNLNRIQARFAPYLGIETLSGGFVGRASYDRTFSFPMRLEAGFPNIAFLFGDVTAVPFAFNLIPSFDTDVFEVGVGAGYTFAAYTRKRGITFLQKIRLGTVDGLSFSFWNSFMLNKKEDDWYYDKANDYGLDKPCNVEETGYGFFWNGLDADLNIPLTRRVALNTHWGYYDGGWLYGELGIKTLVLGNGGSGSLFIPVSIGGAGIFQFETESQWDYYCDSSSGKTVPRHERNTTGGPIISIGIDYRWR